MGGSIGWIELNHDSWGVAEEAGVIFVTHEIYKNGQLYATHWRRLTTAYDGSWRYDAPYHEVPLGPARYELKARIQGPNEVEWGRATDVCLGS
jgi:hypothetical protein